MPQPTYDEHMLNPVAFEPVFMKNSGDCGIVCLQMLLGKSYPEVFAACPKRGKPQHNGLTTRQMINVAARLGSKLDYFDVLKHPHWLDDEAGVGILDLDTTEVNEAGHYVMWAKGTIYDPAQDLYWTNLEAYLNKSKLVVAGLLWRTK